MDILITLIIGLIGGLIGGYRLALWLYKSQTDSLQLHNSRLRENATNLQEYTKFLFNEITNKYSLSDKIIQQTTTSTSASLAQVVQLLQLILRQQSQSLSTEEQQKISQLINQAKAITTTS